MLIRNRWPVYTWGPVGAGKSYLAVNAFVVFAGTVKFYRWCDFIGDAMGLEKEHEIVRWQNGRCCEISHASFWRVIETVGLLVIDEIGTGTPNEWRNELCWKLLELRKDKPLIVTGNIDPRELHQQFDVRIQSRFCDGQFYEVRGRDQRRIGMEGRIHSSSQTRSNNVINGAQMFLEKQNEPP